MIPWPKVLGGSSNPLGLWLNRFLSSARQCEPVDIEGYRLELSSNGWKAKKKYQTVGAATSTPQTLSLKPMIIMQLGSSLAVPNYDLLICQEWDPVTNSIKSATNVYVAKTIEARRGITQEYFLDNGDNITQGYAYFTSTQSDPTYGDNFRIANDGTNTELQAMEKRYYARGHIPVGIGSFAQCIVYVMDTGSPTGVKDPSGAAVTRIEVKPFREWARYATQA